VLGAAVIAGLWLRQRAAQALDRWIKGTRWGGEEVRRHLRVPSLLWVALASLYLAAQTSALPAAAKSLAGQGLGSLFLLSVALAAIPAAEGLLQFHAGRLGLHPWARLLATYTSTVLLLLATAMAVIALWGVSTSPWLWLLAVVILTVVVAVGHSLLNVVARFRLRATEQLRVGDYIKLDSGEEGYITGLTWRATHIRSPENTLFVIPHRRLVGSAFVKYGHLKRAREPFRFYSRLYLKELTGLRARNLRELTTLLKEVPESAVFYHTHHFLEEHHYLTPEPPNDFALWATDVLGDDILGERLASVDTLEFPTLHDLRQEIVSVMEEHLAGEPEPHNAPEGMDFHFIKSISAVFPTPYVVYDLREFLEVVRHISPASLYFHMFEARLRLGRGLNDFSLWIRDCLGDEELAEDIARLDAYSYTLEGLRSSLVRLIENYLRR